MSDTLISPQTLKLLVDSKVESRQKGARDVASKTAVIFVKYPLVEAYDIVTRELREAEASLLSVNSPMHRRGGLGAVRAIVGSLPSRTHPSEVVSLLSSIIFESFTDVDATVRLAALEAAHALVRQLRIQLLDVCFMQVFWGLASCINDHDGRVALLAGEVSLSLRELITGNEPFKFQTEQFVNFITELLEPYSNTTNNEKTFDLLVVNWCVEWIGHVLDLPGDELILLLWRFLKPLLMISGRCGGGEVTRLLQKCLRDTKDAFYRHMSVQLDSLLLIAAECVEGAEVAVTRKNALEWMLELLNIATDELVHLIGRVIMAFLLQLGSKDLETRLAAQNVNHRLMQLVTLKQDGVKNVPHDAVLKSVASQLTGRGNEESRVAALEWIALILHTDAAVVERGFSETFETVLILLCDQSAHVVHKCIETLCLISGETNFDYFVSRLVDLFHAKADVLLPKAPTIIKQLQLRYQGEDLSQCEKLCLKLSSVLSVHEDKRFLEKVVITLSTLVLTSREFLPLREILNRGVDDERARTTFVGMYQCWRYNTVAALSLCLLSRAYEHAFQLIQFMGSLEMSAATLLQLERLVRLIESPIFAYIRMSLMEPSRCLPLVQTLFSMQLILPQGSPQHSLLYRRLKLIPSLVTLERESQARGVSKKESPIDWSQLLELSREAQRCISDFERRLLLQRLGDTGLP
ncbi:HEAT repeat-containing protein [Trypanosoma cruzi]|nr:HEAT repeat-containing protein [Trypanosoma cruzi]